MIRAVAIGAAVSAVVVVVAVAHPFQPGAAAPPAAAAAGDVTRGTPLFAASCAGCHGTAGTGGAGPNITKVSAAAALAKIAAGGGVMPAGLAKGQDAADIAAFVDSLDAAVPPATTAATAPATTAPPATTAAAPAGPSPASRTAITELKRTLRRGQPQADVLVQHTAFLEKALADDNVFNVRFHAEHLANIVRGEPIRDLDGNGQASNPGDGVGLAGPNGGYVTAAGRLFTTIGADAGLSALDRGRAERASASVAFMIDRLGTIVAQAERAAKVPDAAAARDEVRRIRAAVDDVAASYTGLRDSLAAYTF